MIGIDTNVLVYARREEFAEHRRGKSLLTKLAEGDRLWALCWPVVYEFLRVVTHHKVFDPPTSLADALNGIKALLDSPSLVMLGEGATHFTQLQRIALSASTRGNLMHDAHIATIYIEHGVEMVLTTDKDFARFSLLTCVNPFRDEFKI